MAIRAMKSKRRVRHRGRRRPEKPLSARDRLLAALKSAPRLSKRDADRINRLVQEAREASIADELPARH